MRLFLPLLVLLSLAVQTTQGQSSATEDGIPVIVVATASEYVPRSTTISHPGHAYTDCSGRADYFGRFDSDTGRISMDGNTSSNCSTTFTPPHENTYTSYTRVNYTVVEGGTALYLIACTQTWKIKKSSRLLLRVMGAAAASTGADSEPTERATANARGNWTECPAFAVGSQYSLSVRNTGDARLASAYDTEPAKLEYLSSATLPVQTASRTSATPLPSSPLSMTKVHVTSSPDGGEIYVDGKFYGSTPSEISLPAGEHTFRITFQGKEWNRSAQITGGEINIHAE
jgi:PEGA domain